MSKERKKPVVYIPPNAQINIESTNMESPKTKYERHRVTFDRNAVKKLTKGEYGQDGSQ